MSILILRLEGPLMAFGDVAVDETATVARFPPLSMIAGVLANALGHRRADAALTQALQDGMEIATRLDRPGGRLSDYQTAQLGKDDRMWSSRGQVVGRDGGTKTYLSPNLLRREYWADASATVAVALADDMRVRVADALARPARPLFLGRKSCPPSRPLLDGVVEADSVLCALRVVPPADDAVFPMAVQWPSSLGEMPPCRERTVRDLKDWENGVHTGVRRVFEGHLQMEAA